jgi:hypothetical protein
LVKPPLLAGVGSRIAFKGLVGTMSVGLDPDHARLGAAAGVSRLQNIK